MRCVLAFVFLAASVTACARAPQDAGLELANAPAWILEEELRIGSANNPDQALTRVSRVLIAPSGELLILQPQDRVVRVYDGEGRFLRSIGGRGGGPGGFSSMDGAGFLGDTLYVCDYQYQRVSFFTLQGQILEAVPWASEHRRGEGYTYLPVTPAVVLPDGTGLFKPQVLYPAEGPRAPTVLSIPILRGDRSMEKVDTLLWLETQPRRFVEIQNGVGFPVSWPADDGPLFTFSLGGNGVVIVERRAAGNTESSVFTVTLVDPEGDTTFSRAYGYVPIAMRDQAVTQAALGLRERYGQMYPHLTVATIASALRESGVIPPTFPPITEVATGADGRIWLRRWDLEPDTATWLVIGRTGDLVGQVRVPASQSVLGSWGDVMVASDRDSLDVPYVVRYRIHRS